MSEKYKRNGWVVEWKEGRRWTFNWEHAHNLRSMAKYYYTVHVAAYDFKHDEKAGKARLVRLFRGGSNAKP